MLQFDKAGSGSLSDTDLSHRYLWNPAAVDRLLADEQVDWGANATMAGETMWALTDDIGNVRDVVDSDTGLRIHRTFESFGNIIAEEHYDTSGDPVTSTDPEYVDEAFAFTGRWLDADTGLQNNLNRWYDSSIGRWLSEDPIGFLAGDANLYRYVGNEATNAVDPAGLIRDHDTPYSATQGMTVVIGFMEDPPTAIGTWWNDPGLEHTIAIDPNHPDWDAAIKRLNCIVGSGAGPNTGTIQNLIIVGHGSAGSVGPINSGSLANDQGLQAFLWAASVHMNQGSNTWLRSCNSADQKKGREFLQNLASTLGSTTHGITGQWAVFPFGDAFNSYPDGTVHQEPSIWDYLFN